jgi:hypothetical protein
MRVAPGTTCTSIVIAAVVTAAAAGCGKSGGSSSPASAAALNAIPLRAADLPAGWTGTAYQADPTAASSQAAITACVGVTNTDTDKVAEVHSPDFAMGDATISSQAESYRSASDLTTDIAILHSPKATSCYEQEFRTELTGSLPAGTTIKDVQVKITPGSAGGASNIEGTASAVITVVTSGQTIPVFASAAFITGPQIEAEIDFESPNQPVPAALQAALVNDVAARAARA